MEKLNPILSRLIALMLPFLLLLIIEVILRLIPGLNTEKHVDVGPFSLFSQAQLAGRPHYKVTYKHAYANRSVTFPVEKGEKTIRIFCLGGSASAGWPHSSQEVYSTYLEQALGFAFPGHKVEVINVSAHGFASYRVRTIFDKIVTLSPDAVIVYSGNNEFLESRPYAVSGFFTTLAKLPLKLKLASVLQGMFHKAALSGAKLEGVADFFWKKVQKEALKLREDPLLFEKVKEHYAESISYIAEQAAQKKIPLLVLSVPVNLRDWMPNVSHNPLKGDSLDKWQELYNLGQKQLLLGENNSAAQVLTQAAARNPQHAETHFWLARAWEAQQEYDKALENYISAKDLDYNPFRAHSSFNRSLRQIAQTNKSRVFLVDLEQVFIENARNGLPGFDLFLDYVHPKKVGNLIIAEKVFDAIVQNNLLEFQPTQTVFQREDVIWRRDGKPYREDRDFFSHMAGFGLACLTHQYDAAIEKARFIKKLLAEHKSELQRVQAIPESVPEQVSDVLEVFTAYQEARRKKLLGLELNPEQEELANKMHQQFYGKWYKYGKF